MADPSIRRNDGHTGGSDEAVSSVHLFVGKDLLLS